MGRVLLISYGFPPAGRIQSQTVAKLAKSLAGRGWTTEVVTVSDPPSFVLDEGLLAELPDTILVRRAYSLEPTRLLQIVRAIRGRVDAGSVEAARDAGLGTRSYTSLPDWAVRLIRACFIPDEKVGWTPFAVREALRAHAERPFDIIISSGPPYTAHGIGWRVARRLQLPWVANLMDPIFGCYAFKPLTPLHSLLMCRYEAKVVARASHITIASSEMREDLVARHPEAADRVTTIPNCFDPWDFEGPEPGAHSGFVIAYVGMFQLSINPRVFFRAVSSLIARNESFARDVCVRIVGALDPDTDRAVAETGLQAVVERTGFVSHVDAVAQMRSADVLLLVLGSEPESRAILTSKLPEYLAAGKTVLALVPTDGVAADAVWRSGAGLVVDPRDLDGATEALGRLYLAWRSGSLPRPNPDVVAEFNREIQVSKLDAMLNVLVAERTTAREASLELGNTQR